MITNLGIYHYGYELYKEQKTYWLILQISFFFSKTNQPPYEHVLDLLNLAWMITFFETSLWLFYKQTTLKSGFQLCDLLVIQFPNLLVDSPPRYASLWPYLLASHKDQRGAPFAYTYQCIPDEEYSGKNSINSIFSRQGVKIGKVLARSWCGFRQSLKQHWELSHFSHS